MPFDKLVDLHFQCSFIRVIQVEEKGRFAFDRFAPQEIKYLEAAAPAAAGAAIPESEQLVAIPPGRKVIGLFSGGTFCHEARAIAATVPDTK